MTTAVIGSKQKPGKTIIQYSSTYLTVRELYLRYITLLSAEFNYNGQMNVFF